MCASLDLVEMKQFSANTCTQSNTKHINTCTQTLQKARSEYCCSLYLQSINSFMQCTVLKYNNFVHYYNTAGCTLVSQLAVWGTMDSRQPPNSDGQTPVQSFVHSLVRKTPRNCTRRQKKMCLPTWWVDLSSPYQFTRVSNV